jgi:hypothetical protein
MHGTSFCQRAEMNAQGQNNGVFVEVGESCDATGLFRHVNIQFNRIPCLPAGLGGGQVDEKKPVDAAVPTTVLKKPDIKTRIKANQKLRQSNCDWRNAPQHGAVCRINT